MRDRPSNLAGWAFTALVAIGSLVAIGALALALGLGADEEPAGSGRGADTVPTERRVYLTDRGRGRGRDRPPRARRDPLAKLADSMSLPRQVAQLFLLGFEGRDLTAPIFQTLRERDLGGIVVDDRNYADPDQLAALAGEPRVIAEQEGHVRPWVVAPQEGGEFNAFPDLPPATAAADLRSNTQAYEETARAAGALGEIGLSGVLAPVVDVAPPDAVALGARAYSGDPREVATYATAVVDAYREAGMLSVASHFPGLGAGTEDTRYGVSQVSSDLDRLRDFDLVPFRAAIRAGVPAIQIGHGLYVTDDYVVPATLSPAIVTDLLRGELGFEGVAVTDDLADPPITALDNIPHAAVAALVAGADLIYLSGPREEQEAAFGAVLWAARRGEISRERLREALLRNLAAKRDHGLLDLGGRSG